MTGEKPRNVGASVDFGILGDRLLSFFGEPWDAVARRHDFHGSWKAGGPWRHE